MCIFSLAVEFYMIKLSFFTLVYAHTMHIFSDLNTFIFTLIYIDTEYFFSGYAQKKEKEMKAISKGKLPLHYLLKIINIYIIQIIFNKPLILSVSF